MIDACLKTAIGAHALRCYPQECCGLVVDGRYVACTNVADYSQGGFVIDAAQYATAEDQGRIEAIVHSHPDSCALPSAADLFACEASGVALWIIVSVGIRASNPVVLGWHECKPAADGVPLIGCEFSHGTNDCYGLVRRYYRAAFDVGLPDFPRDGMWWKDGRSNLYADHYRQAGFDVAAAGVQVQPGDVLLMNIASDVPNHAAVYVGNDEILHHLWGQLSRRESLPRYRKHVTHILRHSSV